MQVLCAEAQTSRIRSEHQAVSGGVRCDDGTGRCSRGGVRRDTIQIRLDTLPSRYPGGRYRLLVGNAVSLATNGKRGRGLSLVATSGVVMAYTAATAVALFRPGAVRYNFIDAGFALLFLTLSLYIAVSRFK